MADRPTVQEMQIWLIDSLAAPDAALLVEQDLSS
jgi:hypothetical protein